MLRANHYDAAFEEFLRRECIPYVAVDESRRSCLAETTLKSLDFVVGTARYGQVLVDVKGRRAPHHTGDKARFWENWVTQDDLESMAEWEQVFGGGSRAMLVFAYWLSPEKPRDDLPAMLSFRGRDYGFFGVWAANYRQSMRVRSPRWETVCLRTADFQSLRFPLDQLSQPAHTAAG